MPKSSIELLLTANNKIDKELASVEKKSIDLKKTFNKTAIEINAKLELINKGLRAVGKAFEFIERGAKLDQQREAFDRLAKSAGVSAKEIVAAMREMSGGTVSAAEAISGASKAMILGLSPDKLPKLMEIARASARAFGTDVNFMFESLTLGIGRQSRMLLDNLGIIVDAEGAYARYAEANNIVGRSLTDAEKKQAFLNAALEAGQDQIDKIGSSMQTNAETIGSIKAQWKDYADNLSSALSKNELVQEGLQAINTLLKDLSDKLQSYKSLKEAQESINNAFNTGSQEITDHMNKIRELQELRQTLESRRAAGSIGGEVVNERINALLEEEKRLLNEVAALRVSVNQQASDEVEGDDLSEAERLQRLEEEKNRIRADALIERQNQLFDFQKQIRDMDDSEIARELSMLEQSLNNNKTIEELKTQAIKDEVDKRSKIDRQAETIRKQSYDNSISFLKMFVKDSKEAMMILSLIANKDAINNTFVAANRALKDVPFPLNIPAAAIVTAAGLANAANITGFAEGTDTVPSMLTPGEMVVPRSFAQAVRSGDLTLGGPGGAGGDVNIFIQGGINPEGQTVDEMAERLGFEFERQVRTARGF